MKISNYIQFIPLLIISMFLVGCTPTTGKAFEEPDMPEDEEQMLIQESIDKDLEYLRDFGFSEEHQIFKDVEDGAIPVVIKEEVVVTEPLKLRVADTEETYEIDRGVIVYMLDEWTLGEIAKKHDVSYLVKADKEILYSIDADYHLEVLKDGQVIEKLFFNLGDYEEYKVEYNYDYYNERNEINNEIAEEIRNEMQALSSVLPITGNAAADTKPTTKPTSNRNGVVMGSGFKDHSSRLEKEMKDLFENVDGYKPTTIVDPTKHENAASLLKAMTDAICPIKTVEDCDDEDAPHAVIYINAHAEKDGSAKYKGKNGNIIVTNKDMLDTIAKNCPCPENIAIFFMGCGGEKIMDANDELRTTTGSYMGKLYTGAQRDEKSGFDPETIMRADKILMEKLIAEGVIKKKGDFIDLSDKKLSDRKIWEMKNAKKFLTDRHNKEVPGHSGWEWFKRRIKRAGKTYGNPVKQDGKTGTKTRTKSPEPQSTGRGGLVH